MYIVVVGIGRTGQHIVELATRDQHEVVVVEKDADRASAASMDFDCLVIRADATDRGTLEEADAAVADALVTTTPEDAVNLMVMMLGRELGTEHLLSSVSNAAHTELFQNLGVHIVESPHRLNGQHLYRAIQRPTIRDFMKLGDDAEILEVAVEGGAPLAGRSLADLGQEGALPEDTIVVAVRRGDDLLVPSGPTVLEGGDRVTIFSRQGATEALLNLFARAPA